MQSRQITVDGADVTVFWPLSHVEGQSARRTARVQICLNEDSDSQNCRNATQAESDSFGIKAVNGRALPKSN